MSAIGAALGRGVASLGGPQVAAVVIVAGLVAGVTGGAAIGSGGFPGQAATTSGELAVYPCPDQGPALLTVKGGQKLLATGRTEDGVWLRIHFPLPGRTEAWVQASPLSVSGAVDSLPVAECAPEFAAGSPDVLPGATLTAILNLAPTPAPTPEPTPEPTATPTPNKKPSLASLTVSTAKISYDQGSYCPTAVKKVTFKVKAGDDEGVDKVTLFWREPGAGTYAQSVMSRSAGTEQSGTWQVTLDTTANGITRVGKLAFYAVATDTAGATRRLPSSGASSITVAVCVNKGPAITSASSSSGSSLYWDPLGSPANCQTATNITATVKDADGVKSVTLFYRKPGSSTWLSKPMDNRTIPGKWYANLDTLGDKITIVSPPTDTLSWYIKAVDGKNVASQTKTASITVRRCDVEAVFGSSSYYPTAMCLSGPTSFYGSASDPDGIGGSSAVFVYTYRRTDGTTRTAKKRMTGNNDGDWYYWTSLQAGADWSTGRATMTFYIQTTDRYGGVSTGGSGKILVTGC